jgi:hypothetical protein
VRFIVNNKTNQKKTTTMETTVIKDTQYTKQTFKPLISNDSFRPALKGVYIDTLNKCMVAADGYKLVKFPFKGEGNISNVVEIDTFPTKKTAFSTIRVMEKDSELETPERSIKLNTISEKYPAYESVEPKGGPVPIESIKIDLKLFHELYQSLKTVTGKNAHVELTFTGKSSAIKFKTHTTEPEDTISGFIMPMRQ